MPRNSKWQRRRFSRSQHTRSVDSFSIFDNSTEDTAILCIGSASIRKIGESREFHHESVRTNLVRNSEKSIVRNGPKDNLQIH